jgi:hypothetical protein
MHDDADSKKPDAVRVKTYDQYEKLLNCLDELGWKWSSGDVIRFGMHYYMDYKDKTYVALYNNKTIAYGGERGGYYNFITLEEFMNKYYKRPNFNKEIIKLLNDKYK